jgi:hypothetical protein
MLLIPLHEEGVQHDLRDTARVHRCRLGVKIDALDESFGPRHDAEAEPRGEQLRERVKAQDTPIDIDREQRLQSCVRGFFFVGIVLEAKVVIWIIFEDDELVLGRDPAATDSKGTAGVLAAHVPQDEALPPVLQLALVLLLEHRGALGPMSS